MMKAIVFTASVAVLASGAVLAAAAGYVPTRTVLQDTQVPSSNYVVTMVVTEIAPNMRAARHTHPGVEVAYVLQGEADFEIEGKGTQHVKAGGSFKLESGVKHSVKNGPMTTKILAVYTTPKGAEMATPAP